VSVDSLCLIVRRREVEGVRQAGDLGDDEEFEEVAVLSSQSTKRREDVRWSVCGCGYEQGIKF
jgi:hypothetical protein